MKYEHTQNWIAFEVGIAAGCDPPKPVIALKAENIDLPIPYLTHYFSYSSTLPPPQIKESDKVGWPPRFGVVMHSLLSDPNNKPLIPKTRCSNCNLSYYYHGPEDVFDCPCCSNSTMNMAKHRR